MTLLDTLVRGREVLLDAVLGVDSGQTLNDGSVAQAGKGGGELATEIKRAVNAFKAAAIDDSGQRVDYARLHQSEAYAAYRAACSPQLRHLSLATLTTREEQLAFWINLYNALVIDAVIGFGVRQSVTEGRAGLLRFFRRAAYNVGGRRFNLEEIEHGILRNNRGHPYLPGPQFGPTDPRQAWVVSPPEVRVHFALNCASRSCSPIGVYDPGRIDGQLDLTARNFVANEVEIDVDSAQVRLSPILRWYAVDFGGREGVVTFLIDHLPAGEGRQWLAANRSAARLVHRPYDWSLNA